MKLVHDANRAWRWFSVQALTVIAVLPAVWVALPADVKAMMPADWQPWVFSALAVAGIIGRIVDQSDD